MLKLEAVDGPNRRATFRQKPADGDARDVEVGFEMLHVCPPQKALETFAQSPLSGEGGWIEVDQETLRHKRYANYSAWATGARRPTPRPRRRRASRRRWWPPTLSPPWTADRSPPPTTATAPAR